MLCRPWPHLRTGLHKLDDLRTSEMPLAKQPAAGINRVAYSAPRRLRLQHTRERPVKRFSKRVNAGTAQSRISTTRWVMGSTSTACPFTTV